MHLGWEEEEVPKRSGSHVAAGPRGLLFMKLVSIDPMQQWLPLYCSFVRIQNSLTNLVRDNEFFSTFVSKTRLVRLI